MGLWKRVTSVLLWIGLGVFTSACKNCVPYGSFDPQSITIEPSLGVYKHFHPQWKTSFNDISLIVTIKGRNDARILFSTYKNYTSSKGVEIIFGSFGNSEVRIFDMYDRSGDMMYITPIYHGQIISEYQERTFWMQWQNGETSMGFGTDLYRNIILTYRNDGLSKDTNWKMPIVNNNYNLRYISFSSWDVPVTYSDIRIGRAYVPRSSFLAPVFGTSADYVQFNQPNIAWLLASSFEVIFEIQAISDAAIGFLTSHKWNTEDKKAIEIVFQQMFDRQHLYTRSVIRYGTGFGGILYAENNETDVLSPTEFRPFWIRYHNRYMAVGRGIVPGKNILLETDEPMPMLSTQRVVMGFTSYFFSIGVRVLYHSCPLHKWESPVLHDWKPDTSSTKAVTFKTGTHLPYERFIPPVYEQECYGKCYAQRPYEITMPVVPRYQWWHNGAYCAELAIQQNALSIGAYLSQAVIRKMSPFSGEKAFHGDDIMGYEIVPDNIQEALHRLGIKFDKWDVNQTNSYPYYLKWLKSHLVSGHPIVWYVQTITSKYYEHAESLLGYLSDHPLQDKTVYPNDMLQYYSGSDLLSYYRRMDSLVEPNCSTGITGGSECILQNAQVGYAFMGWANMHTVPTTLTVSDGGKEPAPPIVIRIYGTVTTYDLQVGQSYSIDRYEGVNHKTYISSHIFLATERYYIWKDPVSFLSSAAVYYMTQKI